MLIQRRPGEETISTRGSVRSGAASAVARPRRPNGLRGRLGIAGTERIVGGQRHAGDCTSLLRKFATLPTHSWTHPEGGRDWPYEPPPTCSRSHAGKKVAIPSGSNQESLGDAVGVSPVHLAELEPPPHSPGGGSKSHAGRCPEVQGMS